MTRITGELVKYYSTFVLWPIMKQLKNIRELCEWMKDVRICLYLHLDLDWLRSRERSYLFSVSVENIMNWLAGICTFLLLTRIHRNLQEFLLLPWILCVSMVGAPTQDFPNDSSLSVVGSGMWLRIALCAVRSFLETF